MDLTATNIRIKMGDVLYRSPWHWQHNALDNDEFVFWIICDGRGSLQADEERFLLSRDACLILRIWENNEGIQVPDKALHIPWFVFEYIDPLTNQPFRPNPLPSKHRTIDEFVFLETLTQRAIAAWHAGNPSANDWLKTCLLEVERQDQLAIHKGSHFSKVMEIADEVRRSPGEYYPLESIAEKLCCTPDHAIRLFKKHAGTTPREMLVRARIERARHLLRFSDLSIGQIADKLGYKEVSFFSRQFSVRNNGVTPKAFRKR